jgi:hypothetical protein
MVELASSPGWAKAQEVMDAIPGKTFEFTQDDSNASPGANPSKPDAEESARKPLTLVYFLGGVTYAEISALRHLSERASHNRDYLIATTKITNGKHLLESLFEDIPNKLDKRTVSGGKR